MKAMIIEISGKEYTTEQIDSVRREVWLSDKTRLTMGQGEFNNFLLYRHANIKDQVILGFHEGELAAVKIIRYE